jgi:hypothetical protein
VDLAACTPSITRPLQVLTGDADTTGLASHLRKVPAGQAVLVAGHSNTVPALIDALGVGSVCPGLLPLNTDKDCWLPDDQFDHLFVVTFPDSGAPTVQRLRYGQPTD